MPELNKHDSNNNFIETKYVDADGKLTEDKNGIAIYQRQ